MDAPDFACLASVAIASVAAGLAYAMIARPDPKVLAAKVLAWVAALGFGSLGVIWGVTNNNYSLGMRVAAAAILAAVAAGALVWVLSDIHEQEKPKEIAANHAPPVCPPGSPARPDVTCVEIYGGAFDFEHLRI